MPLAVTVSDGDSLSVAAWVYRHSLVPLLIRLRTIQEMQTAGFASTAPGAQKVTRRIIGRN